MGTRSLLAYEIKGGKVYVQYQQFDGYPESKGREYYLEVLTGLTDLHDICNKAGKPTEVFFTRIKHYLNEKQYSSGHSVGNHFTVTKGEWETTVDCNAAWKYLFTRGGDFVFSARSGDRYEVVIPWEFTRTLLQQREPKFMEALADESFWTSLKFRDREENKKVISWGKDAPLHIGEELDHKSSEILFERLMKGEGGIKLPEPVLSLEYGECLAFPEQAEGGWRRYAFLMVGDKRVSSMFVEIEKRHNKGETRMTYRHIK
jgi:hypothetical protein